LITLRPIKPARAENLSAPGSRRGVDIGCGSMCSPHAVGHADRIQRGAKPSGCAGWSSDRSRR